MPIVAWIDERHLAVLGLTNAWGYNPVTFKALDPRLAPGGIAELREMVAALREAGIGVILDLVFNHTGESDAFGPTLSLRGLDNRGFYRHDRQSRGCWPTTPAPATPSPATARKRSNSSSTRSGISCSMPRRTVSFRPRHDPWPRRRGLRSAGAIAARDRRRPRAVRPCVDAEPWDIGQGGYQLGGRFCAAIPR